MKKEYKYRLVIGPIILLIGIALLIFGKIDDLITGTLIIAGIVLLLNGVLKHLRYKNMPERDERTRKIGAFAAAYSWVVTIVFITMLFWLNHLEIWKMTVQQALGLTLYVMIFVTLIFQWHLKRKGDAE
ncbi:MAG TPA: hypothetical protein ENL45_00925 [Candidatus Woesearchaeota archaeon]|nr:hypothetical protein [Candidatus Woesearchaeota archaeon]